MCKRESLSFAISSLCVCLAVPRRTSRLRVFRSTRWGHWLAGGTLLASGAAWAQAGAVLAPVVVTGTRTERAADESPVRTEVVDREEIRRTHARTLKEALENVPGLQLREVHGKSGYEVSLQGMTSDQVLVLIDGLPITASTGSTVDLSQYLLATVDRVEVVKGAAAAQYGSAAMGGVINVITRPVTPGFSGSATVDGGSRGAQDVSGWPARGHAQAVLEGGTETWRARLALDALDDKGFAKDPAGWSRQGDDIERQQGTLRLAWHPSRQGEAWVEAGTYREDDEQRYTLYVPPNQVPQSRVESVARDRIASGARWTFANGASVQARGVSENYDSTSREFSGASLASTRNADLRMRHLTLQGDLPPWLGQVWQFGADFHHESLDQAVNGASELDGAGASKRSSRELFAQNDIFLMPGWELLLGVRWQDDSDFGAHVAPKASLKWDAWRAGDWRAVVRASAGQGYRVPNLKERHYRFDHSALGYVVIGDPDLKPESSDSYQLGGTLTLADTLTVDANLFYNRVKDLIQVDEAQGVVVNGITQYTYENVGRARTQGVETAVRWQATPSVSLQAAYTWTDTQDLATGSELTRRPRDMGRLGIDWTPADGTTLSARARQQGSELVSTASQSRSPAWSTVDVSVNHSFHNGVSAFAGVDNLFDRQRDFSNSNDYGPISGRLVYFGLSFAFGPTPP